MEENISENNNTLELKSIADIKDKEFIIPSFQRGYRWDIVQVEDLLSDIKEYIDNKDNNKSFLCLQPIVVYKKDKKYAVIDGQQRLTTIAIIQSCLENSAKTYNIEYEKYTNNNNTTLNKLLEKAITNITDEKIKKFINDQKIDGNLKQYDINNIDKLFEILNTNQILKEKKIYHKILIALTNTFIFEKCTLDEYHIILSYLVVRLYFNQHKEYTKKFINLFQLLDDNYSIQFIWYDVTNEINSDDKKAIDIFTRLNIGKIPLTDAELIKALFLKKDNFKDSELDKKLHIAYKWDEIEKTLNNDSFWYFISNDKNKPKKDRIELILELAADINNGKNHELFFDYEQILKIDFNTRWNKIEECFMRLKEWYNDNKMYHYIGLLVYAQIPLKDVYKNYTYINTDIFNTVTNAFLINNKGQEHLNDVNKIISYLEQFNIDNIKHYLQQYNFNESKHKTYLRRILLFADIYTTIQTNIATNSNKEQTETFIHKFPFDLFIKEEWDIEHISPQTTNKLKSYDEQKAWFIEAYSYLYDNWDKKELLTIYPDIQDKNDLKQLEIKDSELYNKIIVDKQFEKILELNIFNLDDYENTIGNLVLLSSDINRSYGNKLYGIKKSEIIHYDKKGRFIPLITKNTFLKYYSKSNNANFWTIDDAKDLLEEISKIIMSFIENFIALMERQNEHQ